jgi:hypothetical protein
MTRDTLNLLSDLVGFISSGALAWQALRLMRHLKAVRDLRAVAERKPNTRTGELAAQGATVLEQLVSRWDARDQQFVVVGAVGLALSFFLKMAAFWVK